MNIVFMGTPDFSVPTLQALAQGPHKITGVFCQPDKEKGRGKKIQLPPVKEAALDLGLPVYQPQSLRTEESENLLNSLAPDLIIVVAYGKILPTWLLELPKYGCINIHASILPKYRGAAPIHWAIINGDKVTGVTIMQMAEGLDTGDMLKVFETDILPNETTGELFDRLSLVGAKHINDVVEELTAGKLIPVKQDDSKATFTSKITKEMGLIDWHNNAVSLENLIRGLNPAPGCYTFIDGKRLKIWQAKRKVDAISSESEGTIIEINKSSFSVNTGDGILEITEVQPENKKRMQAGDFIRGHQLQVGTILG